MTDKASFPLLDQKWKMSFRVLEDDTHDLSPLDFLKVNLTGGGMRFYSAVQLDRGKLLALEMKSGSPEKTIIATARVVWCRSHPKRVRHLVAIEFLWIGWKDQTIQQSIASFIEHQTVRIDGIASSSEENRSRSGMIFFLGYLCSFFLIGCLILLMS